MAGVDASDTEKASRWNKAACLAGLGFAAAVVPEACRGYDQAFTSATGKASQQATESQVHQAARFQLRGASTSAAAASPGTSGAWAAAAACGALAGAAAAAGKRRTCSSIRCALPERAEQREPGLAARSTAVATEQLVTSVDPSKGPRGTYQVGIDFANWLQSAKEELEVDGLRVEGKIPPWLIGNLVHAGPAKFEFGDDEFVDWVDGQAMLYRLQIRGDGKCQYKNKWLDTWNHRMHREAGRIAVRETCSRPSLQSFWERFQYMFNPPNNENGNLHISQIAGHRCVSMSVGSACLEFNLEDMKTLGKVPFDDELVEGGPLIFHAEPHLDKDTGEWITCAIQLRISMEDMGLKPEYVVFAVAPDTSKVPGAPVKRRLIQRISTEYPSPVHTIALTKKYVVMIQIPYPLNWEGMLNAEGRWLMDGVYEGNLNDYNTWQPERPTLIRLIDRETGEEAKVFETDPFFFFHIINSFEEKGGANDDDLVHLDVVCYNQPPVGFPLRQARSGDVEDWRGGGGEVRRFTMNLTTGECSCAGWPDNCFDEPKINPKVDGVRHRFSWGVIDDNGMLRLTKQDHDTHEVVKWMGQDVSRELPWQPVFVPEPYSDREDAGCLLSFVRDQPTGNNFCVILDASNMEERARVHFPENHHIPLHGHGTFIHGRVD
eukprot:TRINITY_DN3617_c0_g1_i4.p1 TRINITY_DN3617_c0_g1~~TRINITY_DN3617_c0_g1_i4.p1  ORF type:complete len:677 (-),score=102.26 TRINITY_DN3617_c0_g1_i4:407-2389(-)